MDVLTDDQALQGVIGRELGLDNPALDLPSDFEDIIFKGDGTMCLPDDAITLGVLGHTYTPGTNGSCSLAGQGHSSHQVHGHLGDPQGQRHVHELEDQLSQQLQQQYQQDQQHQHQHQQHHHHQQQQHPQHHPSHQNNSCEHQGHHQHHHHQQQQQQQQQQNPSYCSISGQPQLPYEGYDHTQLNHTSLPDSPPDSGSEPYSPPDGNHRMQAMTDLKSTIPGSLPTLPPSMYLGCNNRMGGMPPTKAPPAYIGEPPKLNHHHHGPPPQLQQQQHQQQQQQQQQQNQRVPMFPIAMVQHLPHQMSPPLSHPIMPAHMGSIPNLAGQATKKRKYTDSPTGTLTPAMMHGLNGVLSIKQEPPGAHFSSYMGDCSGGDEELPPYDIDSNGAYIDSTYQVIKWQHYNQTQWVVLLDGEMKDLPTPHYKVDADKGFNFSMPDEAFVCQKKNHFQVTVHMRLQGSAQYVRTAEGLKKIESFYLHFYGVKMESQNQMIRIEQSQSDRSKKSFHPVKVDLTADQDSKVTVGRLHFSETTSNNMRKKGKPNPDQRYFLLVVSLHAHSGDKDYMIVGSVSDRIIVRASNPGQFDSDVDIMWQKGQNQDSVYHMGRVGINTDHPEEALTVHGNMRLTGHMTQPSDKRAKESFQEVSSKNQLENVAKMRIYRYRYKDDYADQVGIPPNNREDTGVLAQEILDVLPDAVLETGDVLLANGEKIDNFLVVNKDRIYMENVGAVKELCKLTDNLEVRIDQLEKMNRRLGNIKRFGSLKSNCSSLSAVSLSTISTTSSAPPKKTSGDTTVESNSQRNTSSRQNRHHNSISSIYNSNCSTSSSSSSFNNSKSFFDSCLVQPLRNLCSNRRHRFIIISLVLLMAFCMVALAVLYILERQKPDEVSPLASNSGSQGSGVLVPNDTISETTTPKVVGPEKHDPGDQSLTSTSTTIGVTTTVIPTQPGYQPVVPPYPVCTEGYCEKLCCPPPHEDGPIIVNPGGDGGDTPYVVIDSNQSGQRTGEIEWPSGEEEEGQVPHEDTNYNPSSDHLNTVIVNLPTARPNAGSNNNDNNNNNNSNNNSSSVDYNVINNQIGYDVINDIMKKNNPMYSVVNHVNGDNRHGLGVLRRKRGAEDAPRPTILIKELDYVVGDMFCRVNGCINHDYSYYVPLSPSFGFDFITLEVRTPTMSHMALCHSRFMWNCPPPASQDNEVTGDQVQQTDMAIWTVRIGNHFRTILNFRVIHSLKGHSVSLDQACSLVSNEDFVVMSYTIQFQRQC